VGREKKVTMNAKLVAGRRTVLMRIGRRENVTA